MVIIYEKMLRKHDWYKNKNEGDASCVVEINKIFYFIYPNLPIRLPLSHGRVMPSCFSTTCPSNVFEEAFPVNNIFTISCEQ